MKTQYYKVKIGYGVEDFISIDKDELEKAHYAFAKDAKVMFKNGVTNGKNILAVMPDYHKTMGWNYGHKMEAEDFADIVRKVGNMNAYIEASKNRVSYYISQGKENLIGTIPLKLSEPVNDRGGVKSIGEMLGK